ncbi:DUF2452 domain-containing protein [Lacihabitans sp. LS3-19]|uniref:DUF2452 domain-containing protein n=1 Tax=Lacihabitans sp. LS3-19 TaxID=2487335 RepID=UPI0020CE82B6|nr:DUF2452 domain-containing protein [Lacihabitans sp. LS3-19]
MSDALDKKNVATNPGLIGYAHTAGSAVIKPEDMGKVKGKAQMAMRQQTQDALHKIYRQIELLGKQAQEINNRIEVSERIYDAQMSFEPIINHNYFLYERNDGGDVLSMVGPGEWGRKFPFSRFLAKVFLMADHTWKVEFINEDDIDIEL